MKKQPVSILLLLAAVIAMSSCGQVDYKKTKTGLLYKIFTSGHDTLVKVGNVVKFNYLVKLGHNDSVLNSSYGKMPGYAPIVAPNPMDDGGYSPAEVFPMMHMGDSVVVVQLVDSLIRKNPMQQLPPFIKKGDKVTITFKVIRVFPSDADARADNQAEGVKDKSRQEAEMAKEMVKKAKEADDDLKTEVPEMQKWLADKKINAKMMGKGTFVEVTNPGEGLQADSGKYVTVRYTGKTLSDGKVFESNMEPTGQPYTLQVGTHSVIPGWDEGLPALKKGGKGTLYIPGALAYGRNPRPGSPFKVNDALIFDIVIVDVSETPPQQQQPQMQPPPPPPPAHK